jgi:hypothetical protein
MPLNASRSGNVITEIVRCVCQPTNLRNFDRRTVYQFPVSRGDTCQLMQSLGNDKERE